MMSEFYQKLLNNKNKVDSHLFYLSFLASLISLFVLSIQGVEWILFIKKGLFILFSGGLFLYQVLMRRLPCWYYVFASFVVFLGAYFERIDLIAEFILLSWLFFISDLRPTSLLSRQFAKYLGFALCFIVCAHFYFFDYKNRQSIGLLDPNFTSFLIYLIIPFAFYSRSILLHFFIAFLGLMTESRAFFLAMGFYLFFFFFYKIWDGFRIWKNRFLTIFFSFFLLVIFYSYYGFYIGIESYGSHQHGIKRLFYIFNNPSDFGRWKANVLAISRFFTNPEFLLLGSDPFKYLNEVYIYLPHNLILLELATHGVFVGVSFLIVFFFVFKKNYQVDYFPFFMGVSIYWLFLGVEIGAIYNVFMWTTLIVLRSERTYSK